MTLYIHVPFCGSICSYCHFARTDRHDAGFRAAYVAALLEELRLRSERCAILGGRTRPLASAYLGGGTPSRLEPELMLRLIRGTVDTFDRTPDFELTAEANPESLTPELAELWREAGIERVSLGVQSLEPAVLETLGRSCSPETARAALELACTRFCRVSADWILGPRLRLDRLLAELDEAIDLGVEHFSLYLLEVHEGTALARDVAAGRVRLPADEESEYLYLAATEHLANRGFHQYEVANFARPGAESRHNRSYWTGAPYLGLGPGAHGFWGRRRYENERDPRRWLETVRAGRIPEALVDPLDRRARRLERAILALRTSGGLPLAWLPDGCLDLERGRRSGWWSVAGGRLVLSPRGFLRIDGFEAALADRILA